FKLTLPSITDRSVSTHKEFGMLAGINLQTTSRTSQTADGLSAARQDYSPRAARHFGKARY
ncbi:hypothetical protein, partial [Mycobacterium paraintracellulare]